MINTKKIIMSTLMPHSLKYCVLACVLEWMTRLKCFLGFPKITLLSEQNHCSCVTFASPLVEHSYSLFVILAHVSHCCNDEGNDSYPSNGANYYCHHVLFWRKKNIYKWTMTIFKAVRWISVFCVVLENWKIKLAIVLANICHCYLFSFVKVHTFNVNSVQSLFKGAKYSQI